MPNALQTGVAGLSSHSQWLDVIGNNIANINTVGYKARRAVFADLVYQSLRGGTSGGDSGLGGINPVQVGSGSRVAQVALNTAQGNFESTGEALHLALDGAGFFVVQSPSGPLYTRAGAFGVDASGRLVDPATGYRVQRFGSLGDPDGTGPAFQIPGSQDIQIPLGATVPGRVTTQATLRGNLPASAQGPAAQLLQSADPLTAGGSPATAATLLSQLDVNTVDYAAGDSLTISGTDADGTAVSVTLAVTAATTLGDLVTAIDGAFPSATAAIDANGRLQLQAAATGPAFLSLAINDAPGNTGASSFHAAPLVVAVNGRNADTFASELPVYDARGQAHNVQLTFERQSDGSWNLRANLPPSAGTVIDGRIDGLQFTNDGRFALVAGAGAGTAELTFQFAGTSTPQSLTVNFGAPGTFEGLTNLAANASFSTTQDGYGVGSLLAVQVDGDGIVRGVASNGVQVTLAQLAVAGFPNAAGLDAVGQNYFSASASSGAVSVGAAAAGGRGAVASQQLEQSNVDLAYEFTRLIVAQRGFSANARTITVADEMLRELTGLIQ